MAAILDNFKKPYTLLSSGPFRRSEIQEYAQCFTNKVPFMTDADKHSVGLILCDCNEYSRIGELEFNGEQELQSLDVFIIDHHRPNEFQIQTNNAIINIFAPAASLLVQLLYEKLVGQTPTNIAEILFFGIMTDTGFFRFLNESNSDVLMMVSRLVASGVSPRVVYDKIQSGKPFDSRKLLGIALTDAKQYLNGKLIIACETMANTALYGKYGRDTDSLYSALLATEGVQAVVFIRQETDTSCTIGFRSKNAIDVSIVASSFGGGGHKNASGCSTNGTIDTLIPIIVKAFAKIIT